MNTPVTPTQRMLEFWCCKNGTDFNNSSSTNLPNIHRENEMNFGYEILKCYTRHRDNLHVANVVTMLTEMEVIYHLWVQGNEQIKKNTSKYTDIISDGGYDPRN
jgi:hypothetical protein